MVPPKVTASFQFDALHFLENWASDQNNDIVAVMVAIVATVVMGVAIKVTTAKLAK
jgi:hypothetical protein